jgi:putative tricarboxylic transport membrane protein
MLEISKRFGPLCVAFTLLAAAALLFADTFRDDYHLSRAGHAMGPAFFPRIVLACIGVMSVFVVIETLRQPAARVALAGLGRVIGLFSIAVAYGGAITLIGFTLASIIFVVAVAAALGYRRWVVVIPVAVIYAFSVWLLFEKVLLIILPSSPWFRF